MKKIRFAFLVNLVVGFMLASAAASVSAQGFGFYPQGQSNGYGGRSGNSNSNTGVSQVQNGVVIDLVRSEVEVEASTASRVAGGAVGSAACAALSRNADYTVRASFMVACAVGGERAANSMSSRRMTVVELIIKIDGGAVVAVVQSDVDSIYAKGDRVYLIGGGYGAPARVLRQTHE